MRSVLLVALVAYLAVPGAPARVTRAEPTRMGGSHASGSGRGSMSSGSGSPGGILGASHNQDSDSSAGKTVMAAPPGVVQSCPLLPCIARRCAPTPTAKPT